MSRRVGVLGAVAAALLAGVAALGVAAGGDEPTAPVSVAGATTVDGAIASTTVPAAPATAASDPPPRTGVARPGPDPAGSVVGSSVAPLPDGPPGVVCAAAVARLDAHRAALAVAGPSREQLDALDDLEARVAAAGAGAAWADELVAGLTDVRRRWVEALAAARTDDADPDPTAGAAELERAAAIGCPP